MATCAIAQFLEKTIGLRVGIEEEMAGLDMELHGEVGYGL